MNWLPWFHAAERIQLVPENTGRCSKDTGGCSREGGYRSDRRTRWEGVVKDLLFNPTCGLLCNELNLIWIQGSQVKDKHDMLATLLSRTELSSNLSLVNCSSSIISLDPHSSPGK